MAEFINTILNKNNDSDSALNLYFGISDESVNNLLNNSAVDGEIHQYTNDKERFKNLEIFENWINKGKTFYTLVNSNNELCGSLWFSDHSLSEYSIMNPEPININDRIPSFSIRMYQNARGKGYTQNFIKETFKHYFENIRKDINQVWLGVDYDNLRGQHVYTQAGFRIIGDSPEWNEYIMIYEYGK